MADLKWSYVLVALGAVAALGGGWLIAVWAFGLVLIAVGAGLVVWGLRRDDGQPDARVIGMPRQRFRSVQDVLDDEARLP